MRERRGGGQSGGITKLGGGTRKNQGVETKRATNRRGGIREPTRDREKQTKQRGKQNKPGKNPGRRETEEKKREERTGTKKKRRRNRAE
jgi:hypothetical protein